MVVCLCLLTLVQAAGANESGSFSEDEDLNQNTKTSVDDMAGALRAVKQIKKMGLPPGPRSLSDLFRWHERYAEQLLFNRC